MRFEITYAEVARQELTPKLPAAFYKQVIEANRITWARAMCRIRCGTTIRG